MSVQFYNSIIEDEKKLFNVKEASLKTAAIAVSSTYNTSSLKSGSTFLDYNESSNRCAYLFKYAATHTDLVFKYFSEMINHNGARFLLEHKKELKICCLGGGPGTDIVGLFKALATLPYCYQKITHVTVLDLCGGWRNSFKHIVSRLKHGKVEGVPAHFINSLDFQASLIYVNLLGPLPENVVKIIASADILSMVKFVSAVINIQGALNALKEIGNHMKFGAIVLFLDNFSYKTFEPLAKSCQDTGFVSILGPLFAQYKRSGPKSKNNAYCSVPLLSAKVSVIGWIKTVDAFPTIENASLNSSQSDFFRNDSNVEINIEDEGWNTDSDSEELHSVKMEACKIINKTAQKTKTNSNKFTQTESKYFKHVEDAEKKEIDELTELIQALTKLINLMKLRKCIKLNELSYEKQYQSF